MLPDHAATGRSLFSSVFSDDPIPDVEAAIVVAHPGDEAMSASWVMGRLQERASVYCLTRAMAGHAGGTVAAAALAGVPADRCHNLGLNDGDLARDLETLVWLTTAAVTTLPPRLLVTHACEGKNLNHDATAFAVHMTAKLMTRIGGVAPVIVELPTERLEQDRVPEGSWLPLRQAVKIEFGPESRKVKRRMLQCHGEVDPPADTMTLHGEAYVLATANNPLDRLAEVSGAYSDATWCRVDDFRRHAREVAAALSLAVLSSPSRA